VARVRAASDIATLGVRVEIDGVEPSHADFGNELPSIRRRRRATALVDARPDRAN
jgi:hypothetical protein